MRNSKYLDQGNRQYPFGKLQKGICFPIYQALGETSSHLVAKSVTNCMSITVVYSPNLNLTQT